MFPEEATKINRTPAKRNHVNQLHRDTTKK